MFHLGAFYESIDPAGALTFIAAVRERQYFTNGDDFRVPRNLSMLIGAAALLNDASASRAQLQSPSLRIQANLDIAPIVAAAVFGDPPQSVFHPFQPVNLAGDESLNFAVVSDPAAPAAHYGLIWLADAVLTPVDSPFFTVRATATIQQTVDTWENGNLTFAQVLPSGRYQVVGMRCESTDGVGARLVFPDQSPNPGVPVVNAVGDWDAPMFRFGACGVWGEFDNTQPPTFDILGGVAAAQVVYLDLVRVS